ncbi:putative mitochondrial protein [Andalucia godoyi]|uniref:Putative mitochondrial protein n=1 Tax=Andalucia godoyi TaxID=505711 RepID=A0A8K0AHH8_ANDGO|nr:putative mitochondrial protein [Andalucia godoyi]|eukprot:ANDGO_05857.mRNA.1 putative mitochondrial protein
MSVTSSRLQSSASFFDRLISCVPETLRSVSSSSSGVFGLAQEDAPESKSRFLINSKNMDTREAKKNLIKVEKATLQRKEQSAAKRQEFALEKESANQGAAKDDEVLSRNGKTEGEGKHYGASIDELRLRLKAKLDALHTNRKRDAAESSESEGEDGEDDENGNGKEGKAAVKRAAKRSRQAGARKDGEGHVVEAGASKALSESGSSDHSNSSSSLRSPVHDLAFSKVEFGGAPSTPVALAQRTSLKQKKVLLQKAEKMENKLREMKGEDGIRDKKLEEAARRALGEKDLSSSRMLKKQIKKSEKAVRQRGNKKEARERADEQREKQKQIIKARREAKRAGFEGSQPEEKRPYHAKDSKENAKDNTHSSSSANKFHAGRDGKSDGKHDHKQQRH